MWRSHLGSGVFCRCIPCVPVSMTLPLQTAPFAACHSLSLHLSPHFPIKLQAVLFFLALLALWLLGWQCWLASQNVQTEISIGLITMKSCTDIHSRQEMNPNGFGDPLTFPLAHQEVDICGQRVLIPSSSLSSVLSRTSLCALP